MQISGKTLLQSAEGIIKDRKDEGQNKTSENLGYADKTRKTAGSIPRQDQLQAKLLNLQAQLATVQNEYSREQARHSFLSDNSRELRPELSFEGEPLFNSSEKNTPEMKELVAGRMTELTRSLKSVQVEMENLYALNFGSSAEIDLNARKLDLSILKKINPATVARLTRN